MKPIQFLMTCYILSCHIVYCTSVEQEKMSSCQSYRTCYNPGWCEGVLSSRNCSEKHLFRKLECLSSLLADRSNNSQWLDTIGNVTENVTMMMSQVHTLKNEIDESKKTCTTTSTELSAQRENIEKLSGDFKKLDAEAKLLTSKGSDFDGKISMLTQKGEGTGKTIETLMKNVTSLDNQLKSLESKTQTKQTTADALMTKISIDIKGEISNLEATFKDSLGIENEKGKEMSNALEHRLVTKHEQLSSSFKSLNDIVSELESIFNESLHELDKKMHNSYDSFDSEHKRLETKVKQIKDNTERDIQEKTEHVKQQLTDNLSKDYEKLTGKINEVSSSVDTNLDNTDANIKNIAKRLDESENNFENEIKTKTEKLQSNIDDNMKQVQHELKILKTSIQTGISNINAVISNVTKRVDTDKSVNEQRFIEVEKRLTEVINEKISQVTSSQEMSYQETKTSIEGLGTEIQTLIKTEIETLVKKTLEVNQTLLQQQKLVDIIYPNTFNKEMFTIAFLVLVVMVAINFGIVYILVKRSSPSHHAGVRGMSTDNTRSGNNLQEEPHSPAEVFNRLSFPKSLPAGLSAPLSDSVAVISFYEDAQKQHRRLMKKVEELLTSAVKVDYHVIRKHEHIVEIPRAKLCIMFVEFSERHVIIEEPGLGLGDLKRKTASFINTMGACLAIVYVKDPGSRHIKSSDLYNTNIYCVKSQPELSVLSKNGRFLSVYDKLNESQTQRLADVITANVGQGRTLNPGTSTTRKRNISGGKHHLNLNK